MLKLSFKCLISTYEKTQNDFTSIKFTLTGILPHASPKLKMTKAMWSNKGGTIAKAIMLIAEAYSTTSQSSTMLWQYR